LIVYRLHRDTRQPFDYNVNKENRWNPARTPVLYCAATISLCCLEVLVHTDPDLIPDNLIWSSAELSINPEVLNGTWDMRNLEQTRTFGKNWIASRRSLAIRVPSVIVPHTNVDFNILLNPTHDAFPEILWQRGGAFTFDPRLFFDETSV
jgi:RES domain-containing protein